jgi:hypothetical protein
LEKYRSGSKEVPGGIKMEEEKKEAPSYVGGYVVIIVVLLIMVLILMGNRAPPQVISTRTLAVDRLFYFNITKENLNWRLECNNYTVDTQSYEDMRVENLSFFFTEPTRVEFINLYPDRSFGIEHVDRLRHNNLVLARPIEEVMLDFLDKNHDITECYIKARTELRYKIYDEGRQEDGKHWCYIDDQGPFNCYLDEVKLEEGIKEIHCSGTVPTEESLRLGFDACLKAYVEER